MRKIEKPANRTFWAVESTDKSILHQGETNPDQVTETGLNNFLATTEDESEHLSNIAHHVEKFPNLPDEGKEVEKGEIYNDNGTLVKAIQSHTRTHFPTEETPNLFIRAAVLGVIPEWSSFESFEFQNMDLGRKVRDEGKTYELIDKGQGHRKHSGPDGHFGWSEV